MYIKRLLTLLTVLVLGYGMSYAQEGKKAIAGEWELVKMETRLLSQKESRLLERKTLTKLEEFKHVTGFIPVKILVEGEKCSITTARGFAETGRYKLEKEGVLSYQRATSQSPLNAAPDIPAPEASYISYRYTMQTGGLLAVELPGAFYMDVARNLPVLMECTCYYKKKQ